MIVSLHSIIGLLVFTSFVFSLINICYTISPPVYHRWRSGHEVVEEWWRTKRLSMIPVYYRRGVRRDVMGNV